MISSVYVDASSECNDLTFQLGSTVIDAAAVTRAWSIKVKSLDLFYLLSNVIVFIFSPDNAILM